MKIKQSLILWSIVVLTHGATAVPLGGNIVANGDFEIFNSRTPFFPPWQFSHGFDAFINEPAKSVSGNNCVFVGGVGGGDMWQYLNTVIGQTYQFSFYERGDDPGQSQRTSLLNVFWGSQEVGSYTANNQVQGWNYHVITVVAVTSLTELDFQQASYSIGTYGYPGVDAVSVIPITVPDPANTLVLLGIAGVLCAGLRLNSCKRIGCSWARIGCQVGRRLSVRPHYVCSVKNANNVRRHAM